jgi:hypothetical protein
MWGGIGAAMSAVSKAIQVAKATKLAKAAQATKAIGNKCFVPIETIKAGDLVWAENPDARARELKHVVQTFINQTNEFVHISVDGQNITTTPEHPFWVSQKRWTKAAELKAGDKLVLQNGQIVTVEWVQHELLENSVTVYNFEVEDFHTYYVTDSAILVHNACNMPTKITGFTKYGLDQIINRGISPAKLLDAVNRPADVVTISSNQSFQFIGYNVTVVLNKAGEVITAWIR